jgi:hypothetical protein
MSLTLRFGTLDGSRNVRPVGNAAAAGTAVRPRIGKVPAGVTRPFWSVMVPIYNGPPHYLRETLQSVLRQDPGPEEMQIEVIDNCSTTFDPEPIVREVGKGRIAFHRQPENVGIGGNFNACIERASGQWVHILHADDTVRPGFYQRARAGIERHPDAGAALCRTIFMDEDGQWTGVADLEARCPGILDAGFAARQFIDQRIFFVAFVVRRSTYEELGGFHPTLPHCLDWDMWKRIAARKSIYYDPEPMACYRIHGAADSSHLMETGRNVVDERRSIEYSCADLPAEDASRLRKAARKASGVRAVRRAVLLRRHGRRVAARRQLVEALRCSLAPAVLVRAFYFMLGGVLRDRVGGRPALSLPAQGSSSASNANG